MTKYLITSALPYINGIKHLGNIAGSLLPADVYARFLRIEGEEVLFLCATDEHGTPAELSALEAGLDVESYCDEMHRIQADIYKLFGFSFDHFGRSSSSSNRNLTQHFYLKLKENGFIEEKLIQQVYSPKDNRFLPDRYITGECPKCGYRSARGDQCENCTTLLDPTDLINPRSTLSGSNDLEFRNTPHKFLKLSALSDNLREWFESNTNWPRLTRSIALKWLNEGLHDRCITRDLHWGIPVPEEGFKNKVFYVWFDAPIEYIGAALEWSEQNPSENDWKSWWFDANDIIYTQFMAKDNVPFHTVFWPAMILGTREKWTQATQIKSFNWLTYYGGKFSTSQKRGIFSDVALEIRPADYWRYFLLAQSPESDDSRFTWEQFATVINKDLVGIFGNFVNRTLKLAQSKFGNEIPHGGTIGSYEIELEAQCRAKMNEFRDNMRRTEYRKSIQSLRDLWSIGNLYLDSRAPWAVVNEDRDSAAAVLRTSINLIRIFAKAAQPIIPFTAQKIFDSLGLSEAERNETFSNVCSISSLESGRKFDIPDYLFHRIDSDEVEALKLRFGSE